MQWMHSTVASLAVQSLRIRHHERMKIPIGDALGNNSLACCLNAANIHPASVVSSIPVSTASTIQYLWRLLLNTFCTLTFNKYVSGSAPWSSRTCFRAVCLSFTAWMHPSNLHRNPSSTMTSDTGLVNTLMESIQCRHSSNVFTRLSFNQAKNSALFS